MTFGEFMEEIEKIFHSEFLASSSDFEDWGWWDSWNNGHSPKDSFYFFCEECESGYIPSYYR